MRITALAIKRGLALTGMTMLTGIGLAATSPGSAHAEDLCVNYSVTMPFIHPVGSKCEPYPYGARCETVEGGYPPTYAVIEVCVPAV